MTRQIVAIQKPSRMMAGAFAALTLALAGCASNCGANTVSSTGVGYASTVREGTITAVREVTIRPEQNILGAATGAILGGLAGSELGGGDKAQPDCGGGGGGGGGVAQRVRLAEHLDGAAHGVRADLLPPRGEGDQLGHLVMQWFAFENESHFDDQRRAGRTKFSLSDRPMNLRVERLDP